MPKDFTINMNGQDYARLQKTLSQFSECEQEAAVTYGLKEAMDPVIKAGRANLAARNGVFRGNLSRSFTKRMKNAKKGKGIYGGFSRPKGAHAHLVDRGTKPRFTKRGAYRGSMPGTKFWTDAVLGNKDNEIKILNNAIERALTDITKRNRGTV